MKNLKTLGFSGLSWEILRIPKNIADKNCRFHQNTYFMLNPFFFAFEKNHPLRDSVTS